jgi:hypothetical protein
LPEVKDIDTRFGLAYAYGLKFGNDPDGLVHLGIKTYVYGAVNGRPAPAFALESRLVPTRYFLPGIIGLPQEIVRTPDGTIRIDPPRVI